MVNFSLISTAAVTDLTPEEQWPPWIVTTNNYPLTGRNPATHSVMESGSLPSCMGFIKVHLLQDWSFWWFLFTTCSCDVCEICGLGFSHKRQQGKHKQGCFQRCERHIQLGFEMSRKDEGKILGCRVSDLIPLPRSAVSLW